MKNYFILGVLAFASFSALANGKRSDYVKKQPRVEVPAPSKGQDEDDTPSVKKDPIPEEKKIPEDSKKDIDDDAKKIVDEEDSKDSKSHGKADSKNDSKDDYCSKDSSCDSKKDYVKDDHKDDRPLAPARPKEDGLWDDIVPGVRVQADQRQGFEHTACMARMTHMYSQVCGVMLEYLGRDRLDMGQGQRRAYMDVLKGGPLYRTKLGFRGVGARAANSLTSLDPETPSNYQYARCGAVSKKEVAVKTQVEILSAAQHTADQFCSSHDYKWDYFRAENEKYDLLKYLVKSYRRTPVGDKDMRSNIAKLIKKVRATFESQIPKARSEAYARALANPNKLEGLALAEQDALRTDKNGYSVPMAGSLEQRLVDVHQERRESEGLLHKGGRGIRKSKLYLSDAWKKIRHPLTKLAPHEHESMYDSMGSDDVQGVDYGYANMELNRARKFTNVDESVDEVLGIITPDAVMNRTPFTR